MNDRDLQTAKFYAKINNKFTSGLGMLLVLLCLGWIPFLFHFKLNEVIEFEWLMVYAILIVLSTIRLLCNKLI